MSMAQLAELRNGIILISSCWCRRTLLGDPDSELVLPTCIVQVHAVLWHALVRRRCGDIRFLCAVLSLAPPGLEAGTSTYPTTFIS